MSDAAIDLGALMALVGDPLHGGTVLLAHRGDGSAQGPRPDVDDAIAQAAARHGARCAVAWRAGSVPAGEVAFAIAGAAPHRAEAFAGCQLVAAALGGG